MSRQLLNISKDEDSTTPLGNACHCPVTFTLKKYFLMFRLNHLYFSLCPFLVFLSLDTTGNSVFPPFFQHRLYASKIPNELSPLQAEQFQFSQPFLVGGVLQSFNHLNDPLQSWSASLVLSNAKLDRALQVMSVGEGLHPLTFRHHSLCSPGYQWTAYFDSCKCQRHYFSSWCPAGSLGPYLPSYFPAGWPQLVLVRGVVPLQVQDLARLLVKLIPGRWYSCLVTSFSSFPFATTFIYIDGGDKFLLLLFCRWCVKHFKLLSLSDNLFPFLLLWCSFLLLSSTCGNSPSMMANLPHRIEVNLLQNSLPSSD